MSETEALRRIHHALETGKTELEITHLKLERLPEALFRLSNLEMLILHNNRLSSLPPGLWGFERLEGLFLEFNQLTALPPEVSRLSRTISIR